MVIELSTNESPSSYQSPSRHAYEGLIRWLLGLPSQPAVVLLHHYAWWVGTAGTCPGCTGTGQPGCGASQQVRHCQPACLGSRHAATHTALHATTLRRRWKASGDGWTEGLYYREPEGQLSMYSQVSWGTAMCAAVCARQAAR